MDEKLNSLASKIINPLLEAGLIVQRYDDNKSNVIYLKLDYGLCHSISIAASTDAKRPICRYNIGPHIKECSLERGMQFRHFCPMNLHSKMVKQIIQQRRKYLDKYGEKAYLELITERQNAPSGFWQIQKLVTQED